MEAPAGEVRVDSYQVKKAVQALQAYLKSTSTKTLLLDENQQISLLLTLWKVPKQEQTIRIPLPHGLHTDSTDVCLFTRDEPNMSAEQTERFYNKLLSQKGLKYTLKVIPFRALKKEYKPFEAKRKLLGNYDLFLADARIRRLLPSHIGKHFYERKKAPLSVDLEGKHVARDMERLIQGTSLKVSKKGSCCMVRVAHTGMTTDEVVENIITAVNTISSKLHMKGKCIKVIHLKSHTSVALPIYISDLSHLTLLEEELQKAGLAKEKKKDKKKENLKRKGMAKTGLKVKKKKMVKAEPKKKAADDEDEKIPQLVPIESPQKKAKLETPAKAGQKKTHKPTKGKRTQKPRPGQRKLGKKATKQTKKKVPPL